MPSEQLRIVVIGSGGVASSLAPALDALEGVKVVEVCSRNIANAQALAAEMADAEACDNLIEIAEADLYIISVNDDAVASVVASVASRRDAVWVHTSGSVPMSVLEPLGRKTGVFYPLQTFSRERVVDMSEVPFFIEGSDGPTAEFLRKLAARMSERVFDADGDTRRLMHVAAVFACNFTNHLWAVAADILSNKGIPFDVMRPLLEETLRKALSAHPAMGQTGPARRGDRRVMDAHRAMLDSHDSQLYTILSQSIIDRYDSL